MDSLLACPFCGGAPSLDDHRLVWVVRCACGASVAGERAEEPTGAESDAHWKRIRTSAIEHWNTRECDGGRLLGEARKGVGRELSALARDLRDDPLAGLLPFALSDIGSRLEAGMPAIYDPVIIEHKEKAP